MRKLILVGIISVLVVIVFISYLKYDTQRFRKELFSMPNTSSLLEQEAKNGTEDALVNPTDSIIESTTGDEKASPLPTEDLPAGTSEDVAHPNRLRSNTEKVVDVLESGQTPADIELSPEVVALYTDLQPLYDEYTKVGWEYMQVMTKMHETAKRKEGITEELNATSDPETERALRVELKELETWIDANYSIYQALRDETDRRNDAMQTLVESRGFSYRPFDWNAFFKWRGELSR